MLMGDTSSSLAHDKGMMHDCPNEGYASSPEWKVIINTVYQPATLFRVPMGRLGALLGHDTAGSHERISNSHEWIQDTSGPYWYPHLKDKCSL